MTRGQRLKKARVNTGFTQNEASDLSGIIQKEISNLENDKRENIPPEYINFLLQNGVDLNWIYGGEHYGRAPYGLAAFEEAENRSVPILEEPNIGPDRIIEITQDEYAKLIELAKQLPNLVSKGKIKLKRLKQK